MYWPKPGIKNDPYKRWHRPDRIFFGFGACHILAGVYLRSAPLPDFHAEWLVPSGGFSGHHIYVTDGKLSFDFHGYAARDRLITHYRRRWSERYAGWQADIVKVDFDLLDTASLNANKHLGPDQFWADPIKRAENFLSRFNHAAAAAAATRNAAP